MARYMNRAIVMPNLTPPARTVAEATAYYEPIVVGRSVPLRVAAASHGARVFRKDPALRDACVARKLVAEPDDELTLDLAAHSLLEGAQLHIRDRVAGPQGEAYRRRDRAPLLSHRPPTAGPGRLRGAAGAVGGRQKIDERSISSLLWTSNA